MNDVKVHKTGIKDLFIHNAPTESQHNEWSIWMEYCAKARISLAFLIIEHDSRIKIAADDDDVIYPYYCVCHTHEVYKVAIEDQPPRW